MLLASTFPPSPSVHRPVHPAGLRLLRLHPRHRAQARHRAHPAAPQPRAGAAEHRHRQVPAAGQLGLPESQGTVPTARGH